MPEENWRDSYDDVQGVHDEDRLTAADEVKNPYDQEGEHCILIDATLSAIVLQKSYVTNNGWLAFARSQPLGNVPGLCVPSLQRFADDILTRLT